MERNISKEELKAAAELYDHIVDGSHERRQAEAVQWLREFRNPNDTKPPNFRIHN